MTDQEFYNEIDPWFPDRAKGEYDVEVYLKTPTGEVIPFRCVMKNMKSGYSLEFLDALTFNAGDELHINYSERSGT